MLDDHWQNRVLQFWFEDLKPKDWYKSTPVLDQSIKAQFGSLLDSLAGTPTDAFELNRDKILAGIIVMDQFSRNMYRGTAAAFAYDTHAQHLSQHAVHNKLDGGMSDTEKQFCYMPLMHAEDLDKQNQSVELFQAVGNESTIKYAIEHRDVVKQFDRFPHRNEVLNRESTPAEIEYLKTASRYGQ